MNTCRDLGFDALETTVTENLLSFLGTFHEGSRVRKLTGHEEAQLGADFLWAIHLPAGQWLTLWIQAKKASGDVDLRYAALDDTPKATKQANDLLQRSLAVNALPLYAFFNPTAAPYHAGHQVHLGACTRAPLVVGDGSPWAGQSPCGVTLADAIRVRDGAIAGNAQDRRAESVAEYSMPWECLLCAYRGAHLEGDPPAPGGDGGDALIDDWSRFWAGSVDEAVGVSVEPPDWVYAITDGVLDEPVEVRSLFEGGPPSYAVVSDFAVTG